MDGYQPGKWQSNGGTHLVTTVYINVRLIKQKLHHVRKLGIDSNHQWRGPILRMTYDSVRMNVKGSDCD